MTPATLTRPSRRPSSTGWPRSDPLPGLRNLTAGNGAQRDEAVGRDQRQQDEHQNRLDRVALELTRPADGDRTEHRDTDRDDEYRDHHGAPPSPDVSSVEFCTLCGRKTSEMSTQQGPFVRAVSGPLDGADSTAG